MPRDSLETTLSFTWAPGIKPTQASLVFEMYDIDISA